MSFLISCSTPLSIVHSRGQTLCTNERFSVVVRIDKVEINVRVAALCFHMRPDHIFLGKTRIRRIQPMKERKIPGICKRVQVFPRPGPPHLPTHRCPQSEGECSKGPSTITHLLATLEQPDPHPCLLRPMLNHPPNLQRKV